MKKIFALILALAMVLSLAACGGRPSTPQGSESGSPSSSPDPSGNTPSENEPSEKPRWTSAA